VIAELLPSGVASAEAFTDPPEVHLFEEEEAAIAKAIETRRREFGAVRHCARLALGELGAPVTALVPGEGGAPQWPAGVVGSMTHCEGYRAAAVAFDSDFHTLGIDAEPAQPLPERVLGAITLRAELAQLSALRAADDALPWDRLLFCCKEAVYKAWFPLVQTWLGFEDAEVTIDPGNRTFSVRFVRGEPDIADGRLGSLTGRWLIREGLAIAATALRVEAR
jgi:4'-phosphopantetheinyl transferase EntD